MRKYVKYQRLITDFLKENPMIISDSPEVIYNIDNWKHVSTSSASAECDKYMVYPRKVKFDNNLCVNLVQLNAQSFTNVHKYKCTITEQKEITMTILETKFGNLYLTEVEPSEII